MPTCDRKVASLLRKQSAIGGTRYMGDAMEMKL